MLLLEYTVHLHRESGGYLLTPRPSKCFSACFYYVSSSYSYITSFLPLMISIDVAMFIFRPALYQVILRAHIEYGNIMTKIKIMLFIEYDN